LSRGCRRPSPDTLNRLATVTDNRLLAHGAASGVTTYNYDAVGNLQNFAYPNGVTHAYSYDPLNRLTQMGSSKNASSISNYAYTLGAAGNRTSVAELSGRTVAYAYDSLYRLTSETVTADPNNHNGVVSYTYDSVGNRKTLTSTLAPVGANTYNYDTDDRLAADQYDADGNTTNSSGIANTYDFENHLITHGAVTVAYDGDGNRVAETVGGVTTNYLVDTLNPTGYAQVVDALVSGTVTRTYAYGSARQRKPDDQQHVDASLLRLRRPRQRAPTDQLRGRCDGYLRLRRLWQPHQLHGLNPQQLRLRRRAVRPRPQPLLQTRPVPEHSDRQVLVHRYKRRQPAKPNESLAMLTAGRAQTLADASRIRVGVLRQPGSAQNSPTDGASCNNSQRRTRGVGSAAAGDRSPCSP
jgi:YD repeat-containing protein